LLFGRDTLDVPLSTYLYVEHNLTVSKYGV